MTTMLVSSVAVGPRHFRAWLSLFDSGIGVGSIVAEFRLNFGNVNAEISLKQRTNDLWPMLPRFDLCLIGPKYRRFKKKPLDLQAARLMRNNSRDNKTPLELFLAGVRALALQSRIIDVVRIASRFSSATGGH